MEEKKIYRTSGTPKIKLIQRLRQRVHAVADAAEWVWLRKVYNISANEYGGWWSGSGGYWGGRYGGTMAQNAVQNEGSSAGTEDRTLSLGQVNVSATVNVSFLIE